MNEKIKYSFTNDQISVVNPQSSYEEVVVGSNKWVNYGRDNMYPEYLWDLYLNSSTHSAIIDGKVDYIIGEGWSTGDKNKLKVLKKITFDYVLYGGFAIQLIFNAVGQIAKIQPLDFARCRVNQDLTKLYYSPKWKKYSAKNITEFKIYDETELEHQSTEIYYFRGTKTRGIYPIPTYVGSTQSIETSIEIQNYHLNAIKNNFAVSAIINLIGDPSDEEKDELNSQIKENFVGSGAASNFMVTYGATKDEVPSIVRLESDKADERFEKLSKDTKENIFIGHRVTSGALFGLVSESTGFNSIEYQESFKLFNKTVISPIQGLLTEIINEIYNTVDTILPFQIPTFVEVPSTPQTTLSSAIDNMINNKLKDTKNV